MKLIVGLGNPTPQYALTRHNAGFMAIDRLIARGGFSPPRQRFQAESCEGTIGKHKVMLLKPTTYMNLSGKSVGEAAGFYRISVSSILVVVDDLALPPAALRLRQGGSDGGHNGLADVTRALSSGAYPRLRIGIGEPVVAGHRIDGADYVLGRFSETELKTLEPALDQAVEAIRCWTEDGIDAAMNRYNRRSSDERHKPATKPSHEPRTEERS